MAETHIVEVLDEAGRPCRPGETGRVVITDLANFATPIIRYEIGDYAEVGRAEAFAGAASRCCNRILGRQRNLIMLPDGRDNGR